MDVYAIKLETKASDLIILSLYKSPADLIQYIQGLDDGVKCI